MRIVLDKRMLACLVAREEIFLVPTFFRGILEVDLGRGILGNTKTTRSVLNDNKNWTTENESKSKCVFAEINARVLQKWM